MPIARSNAKKLLKILLFVLSLLPLIWLCYAIYSDTYFGTRILTANPIQKLDRELGDWGLIFLILTLCVRPLAEVFNFGGLIIYRRMLGLFAFFYVCLHLLSYLFLNLQLDIDAFFRDITKRNFITIGIIAFVLLIPLAITSNKFMIKWVSGPRWKKLHFLIYPIALLAVWHFFMMVRADFSRPGLYLTIILVLLSYRIWSRLKRKARVLS